MTDIFDVLAKEIQINRHLLIEASAGTGKTFTIEHLFIRRLLVPINGEYIKTRDVAVVTFTRACATELVDRIHNALQTVIWQLDNPSQTAFGYIQAIREEGAVAVSLAKRRLGEAKSSLEEATISTIHSFAGRCLSEYLHDNISSFSETCWISPQRLQEIIGDYFLIDHEESVSVNLEPAEFEFFSPGSVDQIGGNIEPNMTPDLINAPREKIISNSAARSLQTHSKISTHELKLVLQTFRMDQRLLIQKISQSLWKEERQLAHPDALFAKLVGSCQKFVTQVMRKQGLFSPDDLMLQLEEALADPQFCAFLRTRYRALFVDEFQDTDPMQWNLFFKTFLQAPWNGYLYLVGDPKQAIYAFRKADVYSYITAKEAFAADAQVSLTTNFRSTAQLTEATNRLFVGPQSDWLFSLPKLGKSIKMSPVTSGKALIPFDDGKGSIHFFTHEAAIGRKRNWPHEEAESAFFGFIANEIRLLGAPLSQYAILIKDRHQGSRLQTFLNERGIPSHSYRQTSIAQSPACAMMKRLLAILRTPKKRDALSCFLALDPFFFSSEDLLKIQYDLNFWAHQVEKVVELKESFDKKGVGRLAEHFFAWTTEMMENDLYRDSEQLFDLLIQEELAGRGSLDELERYLIELETNAESDIEGLTTRYEPHTDTVSILTMHKSKGLEFDVVFALGVASRTMASSDEEDAEKMRQLYVVCTRAKKRLYLPVLIEQGGKKPSIGTASPLELFFTSVGLALQGADNPVKSLPDREKLYHAIGHATRECALQYLVDRSLITMQWVKDTIQAPLISFSQDTSHAAMPAGLMTPGSVAPFGALSPGANLCHPFWGSGIFGSSGIAASHVKPVFIPKKMVAQRLFIDSFSSQREKKKYAHMDTTAATLPTGARVGTLLHAILSEITDPNVSLEWVTKRLVATCLEGYEQQVHDILLRTYAKSLVTPYGSWHLNASHLQRAIREMEFFYFDGEGRGKATRGVIDFAVEHEGRYYLIDWKATLLDDYSASHLHKVVKECGYDIQAAVYSNAWRRYLQNLGHDPQKFGGLFFVFLRCEASDAGVLLMEGSNGVN